MLPDEGFDIMMAERACRDSQRHTRLADCVARPGDPAGFTATRSKAKLDLMTVHR